MLIKNKILKGFHALKMHAPPVALILLSAVLLKNLALITTGIYGSLPLPRTLKKPAFPTSITGTFPSPFPSEYFFLVYSVTNVHSLSIFIVGQI